MAFFDLFKGKPTKSNTKKTTSTNIKKNNKQEKQNMLKKLTTNDLYLNKLNSFEKTYGNKTLIYNIKSDGTVNVKRQVRKPCTEKYRENNEEYSNCQRYRYGEYEEYNNNITNEPIKRSFSNNSKKLRVKKSVSGRNTFSTINLRGINYVLDPSTKTWTYA